MSKRDYYEVLGISKNASDTEIKSAYRKLAVKFHPDKQAGKSESEKKKAEESFKECSEAYEVLSDKNKRAQYDQFGFDGPKMQGGFGGFNMGDFMSRHASMFESFFGGNPFDDMSGFGFSFGGHHQHSSVPNPNQPENGKHIQLNLNVSFKEAVFGCTKEFELDLDKECTECHGTGIKNGTKVETCSHCNGEGMLTQQQRTPFGISIMQSPCPYCHGAGYSMTKCPTCNGSKRIHDKRRISIKIPAGIDTGTRLRLVGKGQSGVCGGQNGNLYVEVSVESSDVFSRKGLDVYVNGYVTATVASLGGKIDVPTPYGIKKIDIPAEMSSGTTLKIQGLGIKTDKQRGDLYFTANVEPFSNLNSAQKKLVEELHKLETSENNKKQCELLEKAQKFYN